LATLAATALFTTSFFFSYRRSVMFFTGICLAVASSLARNSTSNFRVISGKRWTNLILGLLGSSALFLCVSAFGWRHDVAR
jgi:hypothetical protein